MTEAISRVAAEALQIAPWDVLAEQRARDIDSGADVSFRHVLAPTISLMLSSAVAPDARAIDVGCGTGRLLPSILPFARSVHGIDPSQKSVKLAKDFATLNGFGAVEFSPLTVEQFAAKSLIEPFDVAIVNMVLMDVVNLEPFLEATRSVVRTRAPLLLSITHPFHWPDYWGYAGKPWFSYKSEVFIKSTFRISTGATSVETLHVHRPLDQYTNALEMSGFRLNRILEPILPKTVQQETGVTWTAPHFLMIEAVAE